jgi:flagellar basal-body rod protein FlgG
MNAEGALVTADGNPLEPQITIPSDAQEIVIGSDGTVSVTQSVKRRHSRLARFRLPISKIHRA